MTARCRFGWYVKGQVFPYQRGLIPQAYTKMEGGLPATLLEGQTAEPIVSLHIDGAQWFGRLMKPNPQMSEGIVLLYRS